MIDIPFGIIAPRRLPRRHRRPRWNPPGIGEASIIATAEKSRRVMEQAEREANEAAAISAADVAAVYGDAGPARRSRRG